MINLDEHLAIKKFCLSNLEQVFKLGLDTYGEEETTSLQSLESLTELAFGEKGYYFGVLEFNREFVGYLCLYEKSPSVLSVGDIVIKNEFRGKKFSQRSISALVNVIFKVKPYSRVELTVRKSNYPAIKCYENLNFKIVETLPEYYLDKEDALKMVYLSSLGVINIRRATSADALGIHEAHMRSISEVCSKDHLPAEIQGWGNRLFNEERRLEGIKNHKVWIVEQGGTIEGFAQLQIYQKDERTLAYIHGLYLTSKVLDQGIGRKLFIEMLNEAQIAKVLTIQLEATITAHSFYKKIGFNDYAPMRTVEIGGSKVRCFPMKMDLEQK